MRAGSETIQFAKGSGQISCVANFAFDEEQKRAAKVRRCICDPIQLGAIDTHERFQG